MAEKSTIESMIPKLIAFYVEEAEKLSKAYNMSRTEALQVITLIELAKIHTHVDSMVDVLQLIGSKEKKKG